MKQGIKRNTPVKRDNDTESDVYELTVEDSGTEITARGSDKKKKVDTAPSLYYLGFIGEIGFAIAVPIAGGGLLGVVIDRTWSTTPKATLSLLFLGVVISFMNIYKIVIAISGGSKK